MTDPDARWRRVGDTPVLQGEREPHRTSDPKDAHAELEKRLPVVGMLADAVAREKARILDLSASASGSRENDPLGPDNASEPAPVPLGEEPDRPAVEKQRIYTPLADLFEMASERPQWIVPGYIARGAITELTAKAKVGKTHFMLDVVGAVLKGGRFFGEPTATVPVIYLTEERSGTFLQGVTRVGIDRSDDGLYIVLRQNQRGTSWPAIMREVRDLAAELDAGLVVIDTLSDWAALGGDSENDAGSALEAMRPVQELAEAGPAVVVCRHSRKSGGEVGDAARGSSAFGGAADILLNLQRPTGGMRPTCRQLDAVGRFDDIPPKAIVELKDGHYEMLGTESDVEYREVRKIIVELLSANEDEALTEKDILDALGGRGSRSTAQRVLKELMSEGVVGRQKGIGSARPNAFGYYLLP